MSGSPLLYRVRVGRDEYLGTADEVVAFMARAEGAPGADPASYMEGVARRLRERMGIDAVPTSSATAFLEALRARGVLPIRAQREPSGERRDPQRVLDEGPVTLGEGVSPEDLPL